LNLDSLQLTAYAQCSQDIILYSSYTKILKVVKKGQQRELCMRLQGKEERELISLGTLFLKADFGGLNQRLSLVESSGNMF
jgi:hypothetical protein